MRRSKYYTTALGCSHKNIDFFLLSLLLLLYMLQTMAESLASQQNGWHSELSSYA